jgi:light-regulated signal transduction histidine kinase (bacteriophytochrome)
MDRHDVTEVERLISALSHDLREPLRAINGFGDLLERESGEELSERGQEFLSLMRQAGRRMEDLLDGLSEYGRAGRAVEPAPGVDLDALLETLLLRRQADIEARGARVTHDPLPVVTADPTGVQKLLDQLLDNAL